VLRRRKLLREDRLSCAELSWSGPKGRRLLRKMLGNRLTVFSNGQVRSLAAIAQPDVRDIDDILLTAADASPRRLLNLGDALFQACAATSDNERVQIEQEHLEAALAAHGIETPLHLIGVNQADSGQPPKAPPPEPATTAVVDVPGRSTIPLLRLEADGRIWRGNQLIDGWQRLPTLQRRLLEYLYKHSGTLCSKKDLLAYVWADKYEHEEKPKGADEDSLHKLAARLIKFIEADPRNPIYIRRIYGGFYRLDNAAPAELKTPAPNEHP
jgi:hypothetical protein